MQALSLKFDAVVAKFREDTTNIDDQFHNEKRLCEQQLQKQAAEYDNLSKVLTATIQLTRSKPIWNPDNSFQFLLKACLEK